MESKTSLSEADTKAKLIDPALHLQGWTEDLISREETERGIEIIDGKARRKGQGRIGRQLEAINALPHAILRKAFRGEL